MLWDEAALVTERHNSRMLTENTLLQQAISAILSGTKGQKALKKTVDQLNIEVVPLGSVRSGHDEGDNDGNAGR